MWLAAENRFSVHTSDDFNEFRSCMKCKRSKSCAVIAHPKKYTGQCKDNQKISGPTRPAAPICAGLAPTPPASRRKPATRPRWRLRRDASMPSPSPVGPLLLVVVAEIQPVERSH
ncbi:MULTISPECIES: hypothetical protein [Xanthomonas]|nr:hypothetical protein [Xanthomonas campestris]MCC5044236.1 hypothetical protein [Xanthomonas campestris]